MKRICIDPQTWRHKLATLLLKILYKSDYFYISPWKHTSVGVGAFIFYDGKLLITKRPAHIEHPHKYCIPGGHVDIERNEPLLDCLKREVMEEIRIDLDTSAINPNTPAWTSFNPSVDYNEMKDAANINLSYAVHLTEAPTPQLSDEVVDIKWVNYAEVAKLKADGDYVGHIPAEALFSK